MPPDEFVCVELSMSKGFCTKTISNQEMIVDEVNTLNGQTWFQMRPQFVLVPPKTWAEIKKFIIRECKKSDTCNSTVETWERKLVEIDEKLAEKGGAQ